MELITLDQTTLQPTALLENFTSLVWTERYASPGDFQLVSNDIAGILTSISRESVISLRESTVPMVIEDYKIENPMNAAPIITVTGRSFETVLERRASVTSLPSAAARTPWTITAAKPSDAAYKAMRVVIGDIARVRTDNSMPLAGEVAMGASVLPLLAPAVSANDAISQINLVLPKDYSSLTPNTYEIVASDLYATCMDLIQSNYHGLKAVRPDASKSTIDVEIYNGADLTSIVSFDARFDQFDSATYLLSARASANVAYVYGPNGSDQVLRNAVDGTHPEPSGLTRRVLLVDDLGDSTINSSAIRNSRGVVEIYQRNPTAMFDGQISVQIAAGFNVNYFLGDIILLVGEYGLSTKVRVAEFIRTADASGEKAYPAFEAVAE